MSDDGSLSLIEFTLRNVPSYATLPQTWRGDHEATFQDNINSTIPASINQNGILDKL